MLEEITKKYKKQATKITIGYIICSIMVITFIAFMIVMVEYAIPSRNINTVILLGVTYFGITILRAGVTFFEDLNARGFEKEVEADNREKIFLKLQNMKQKEIDQIRVGEILENIINDSKEVGNWYTRGICRSYFGGVMRLLGTLLVLLYLNIPIVMITLFIYILGFILTHFFNKKTIAYTKTKREINAKILNWSNEQVEGYTTIKSLEIEAQRLKQIKELISEYEKVVNQLEKTIRTYTCVYDFVVSFVGVVNILLGSISVENGIVTYGAMIILARYISTPEGYAKWFIEGFQIRNISKVSYDKINHLLQKEEEDIDTGKELTKIETIEFNDISFGYNQDKNVLNHISFKVEKNESIALVGRTGSGKTTLVNLICRFYDLKDGKIRINGQDYKEYSIRSLRNKIGYIMQKVVIFNGTILENINYANREISKEEMIKICKRFHLHDKIMSLKDGYETQIANDTDIFSAGEKQLLNFARVMVENPDIIILDEATASLSYKSEMMVRKAIEEITKGKISFIIAHRLSTIEKCDQILLLKNGSVIEKGNHNELMEKQGEYYHLVNMELS